MTTGQQSPVWPARATISLATHVAAAVAITFPLATRLDRVPLGTEPTSTVPLFNLWTLRWAADHPFAFGDRFWDAPIFHPTGGAFAFSEPQPLTGLVFAALRHVHGDIVGMSLVLLLAITCNGVAAASVARRLGAERVPAALVGVLVQALPFVIDQFGVLQLTVLAPVLFAIGAVVAWFDDPRRRFAIELGVALAAAALVCGNTALLSILAAMLVGPALVVWLVGRRDELRPRLGGLASAGAIAALLAGPIVIAQQHRLAGRHWLDSTVLGGSASLGDWAPGGRSWPGWILLPLALAGVWLGRDRPAVRWLCGLAVAGLVLSFGLRLDLLGWHPWATLRDVVPGLDRLRSPWRATVVVQCCLALLAAPAVDRLWRARPRVPVEGLEQAGSTVGLIGAGAGARAVAVTAVAISIAVGAIGPGELYAVPATAHAAATAAGRWLAAAPDDGAVVVLPFAPGPTAADFQPTTLAMLAALDDGHPLVNGYSGFFPVGHADLRRALAGFPDDASLLALADRNTTYVWADATWLAPRRVLLAGAGISILVDDPSGVLLRLPGPTTVEAGA